MIRKKAKACSSGLMVVNTLASGTTASSMAEVLTCLAEAKSSKAPGKMERELDGSTIRDRRMINDGYT